MALGSTISRHRVTLHSDEDIPVPLVHARNTTWLTTVAFCLCTVFMFKTVAGTAVAETVRTETAITSIESESIGDPKTATIDQLVSALKSFNGKVITMNGKLEYNVFDKLVFESDGGTRFIMELDDGRSVSKRVLLCKDVSCDVSLESELQIDHYSGKVSLNTIGFDVEFIND